jgi:phosphoglycolate phosphatase
LKSESIDDAVMVGDRAQDIVAARAHGLHSIGVLWGYGSREELVAAGAAALCARPGELPALVA